MSYNPYGSSKGMHAINAVAWGINALVWSRVAHVQGAAVGCLLLTFVFIYLWRKAS